MNYLDENVRIIPDWELGYSGARDEMPLKWIHAKVPGAVQLDIAAAEKYVPYYYADHWKDYLWMENQYFTYRTIFSKPELKKGERLYFRSLGIDYEFEILLNDVKVFAQQGMFSAVSIDLTDWLRDNNILCVKIFPAPRLQTIPAGEPMKAGVTKPAVSYGWDWHPRLVPLGIWDETFLEIRPEVYVTELQLGYTLNDSLTQAGIHLQIRGQNLNTAGYIWTLKDASDKEVLNTSAVFSADHQELRLTLADPVLWWPHDHGKPSLYTYILVLSGSDGSPLQTISGKVGFRRVRLVMNEGAWDEPSGFPKTRSVPPMQMEINGRKVFCKGTNWVNPEIFPGTITRQRYQQLLGLALEANFNMVRVWGGGIINKESFFELCDEYGILVWQDFPLACNNYEGTPDYLSLLERESASIITRLRKHPSLALWCGGNELFNSWSGMTDQSLALRLLNSQCYRLDPHTPFIPTAPIMGMGHGHYVFRDSQTGEEVYQLMARSRCTAYTEFGVPAPASVEVLKSIIPEEELWPPVADSSWETHHAFNAWQGNTWLCQDVIEWYFGPSDSLKELVEKGQLLQAEGYKAIYEEARRQKPYCSMALNWCFNEPWPTAANNSLVSYPAIPKPAFYSVSKACRAVLASARIPKYSWQAGEELNLELWMLSDSYQIVPACTMEVFIQVGDHLQLMHAWMYESLEANSNQRGPMVRLILGSWQVDRFDIILKVKENPEFDSEYTLSYRN